MIKFVSRCFALAAFAAASLVLLAVLFVESALAALAPCPPAYIPRGQAGYMVIDCPPFSNVVASGKATVKLDNLIGYTVDRIILALGGGNNAANMTNIRLLANEKAIFEDTGARVDMRQQYRGITANAAFLSLDFSEIRARTIIGQRVGSIDTVSSKINKLTLEIDLGAGVAPTLSAFAMISGAPQADPNFNRLIAKVLNRTFNPGGAGEFLFDFNFQRVPGSFVKRVHLSGVTATDTRVKKNGIEIYKASNARADYFQTEFQRTPQANTQHIDFIVDGNLSEALPMANAQSMEWYVTASGAGNIVMVAELLDLLENN